MVVLASHFSRQNAARRVIRGMGVPEEVLKAAEEANEDIDWGQLARAFDDVFLSHGGGMGQVLFLKAPQEDLRGRTPIEALCDRDGPYHVRRAALRFARTAITKKWNNPCLGRPLTAKPSAPWQR